MDQGDKTNQPDTHSDHQGTLPLDFEEQQQMLLRRREAQRQEAAAAAAAEPTVAPASPPETLLQPSEESPVQPAAAVPPPRPASATSTKTRPRPPVRSTVNVHATPGRTLQDVRESMGLSLEEVAEKTKIKVSYLEGLEHDRFDHLPPPVYVRAYIRSLSAIYNLSGDLVGQIQDHYQANNPHVVSEEIIHQIEKDKQPNPEEVKKVKRLMLLITGAAVVVLLLIGGSVFLMLGGVRSRGGAVSAPTPTVTNPEAKPAAVPAATAGNAKFDLKRLEQITLPPNVTVSPLPVPTTEKAASSGSTKRRR